jgi:chromosome segregation ATPase
MQGVTQGAPASISGNSGRSCGHHRHPKDRPNVTTAKVTTALAAARADDSARRHDRVVQALDAVTTAGHEINVSAVARVARVHRSFIHRHPQLHVAVTTAQRQSPTVTVDSAISTASLHADLANMHAQNTRLARHITLLEKRLSEALGQQVMRASGLGAVDETGDLRCHITELEQRVADLTEQLGEREDELNAARAANREFMAELNRR